ncbi:MAG: FAD:protein FMN transferase [Desulfofustis sp.]|nr:FAD:protein FMN transferase [Desulfofustis sp.]
MTTTPPPSPSDPAPPGSSGLTRRRLLQLGAAAGVVGTVLYLSFGRSPAPTAVRYSQPLMGTTVNLTVCGADDQSCRTAINACINRMETLSSLLSTYVPDSPLSTLNRHGIIHNAPPELLEVLRMSRELSELTGGAFDPTVLPLLGLYRTLRQTGTLPDRSVIDETLQLVDYRYILIEDPATVRLTRRGVGVTLDGIAKGYIVDKGIAALRANGITDAYVEAGGDLMVIGQRQDGRAWRIGIRNPRSDNLQQMDTIDLSDRAIATSGDYLQYFTDDRTAHHIIDPHTGFSPLQIASSSILAPTVALADGLATATMVLGAERSVTLLETLPDCEGYFFDKQLNKYSTKGFFS